MTSIAHTTSAGGPGVSAGHGPFHLLSHKNWKHQDALSHFLSPDYDEAAYLARTMASSSSAALDQLDALLAEISAEIQSVIVTHHSSLLSLNSHILLIEGEVQLVVRRVASLKASLGRIQAALMQPYQKLNGAVKQLHTVQSTSEFIRQAIRVVHFCDKLKQITNSNSNNNSTTTAASPATPPSSSSLVSSAVALRDLVKAATLLYEIHDVFDSINLNGITAVDAQLPFLNNVSELLHNQGRKILYETMRGSNAAASTPSSNPSTNAAAVGAQVNQIDLNYVVQLFYNISPNPNVLPLLTRFHSLHSQALTLRRGRSKSIESDADATTLRAEEDALVERAGGVELIIVLEELQHSYLEQLRSALRKLMDIASNQTANMIDAAKRSKNATPSKKDGKNAASSTTSSLRSSLWEKLEAFTELCFSLSIQVWTLSRVLHEKKDLVYNAAPGATFGDIYRLQKLVLTKRKAAAALAKNSKKQSAAAPAVSESQPVAEQSEEEQTFLHSFWFALCEMLRAEFEPIASVNASSQPPSATSSAAHSSQNFLRTIFVNEYPRFHALFERNVFDRVSKYCTNAAAVGSVGSSAASSAAAGTGTAMIAFSNTAANNAENPPPLLTNTHRHLLLSSFLPFFQLYLSRTLTSLTEPLTLMFTSHEQSGAVATVPSRSDVASFTSIVGQTLEGIADARDEELQQAVCKAVHKSVNLFTQHVERMIHTENDAQIFSTSYINTTAHTDPNAGSIASNPLLHPRSHQSGPLNSSSQVCSPTQRTNLDLFAILCQVEREFSESELARKYPALIRNAASGSNSIVSLPSPSHAAGAGAINSAAVLVLKRCYTTLRSMQETLLSVLLRTLATNLSSALVPIVVDDEPHVVPSEGSPGIIAFRRRFLYTLNGLFPLYAHQLAGANQSASLSPIDYQQRQALWFEKLVKPLNEQLIFYFLHLVTLQPIVKSADTTQLNEVARSYLLNELTIFESLLQQFYKQPKKSSRNKLLAGAAVASAADGSEVPPMDYLHGLKELLFASEIPDLFSLYSLKSVDAITILHFLFSNCCLTSTIAKGAAASTGLTHTAPHRVLQMKVEEYMNYLQSQNLMEVFEVFTKKVYTHVENQIPNVPKGQEGKLFVQESYPKLALALKILTKK